MARKSKRDDWMPNPDCEAAYARTLETAHICAAALFGEKPTDDPAANASPEAMMHAMGMMYFLLRIDPKDLAALYDGPGSLADFDYKPFPPGYWLKQGVFGQVRTDLTPS